MASFPSSARIKRLTALCVRLSSIAARAKLWLRAAASNAESSPIEGVSDLFTAACSRSWSWQTLEALLVRPAAQVDAQLRGRQTTTTIPPSEIGRDKIFQICNDLLAWFLRVHSITRTRQLRQIGNRFVEPHFGRAFRAREDDKRQLLLCRGSKALAARACHDNFVAPSHALQQLQHVISILAGLWKKRQPQNAFLCDSLSTRPNQRTRRKRTALSRHILQDRQIN